MMDSRLEEISRPGITSRLVETRTAETRMPEEWMLRIKTLRIKIRLPVLKVIQEQRHQKPETAAIYFSGPEQPLFLLEESSAASS